MTIDSDQMATCRTKPKSTDVRFPSLMAAKRTQRYGWNLRTPCFPPPPTTGSYVKAERRSRALIRGHANRATVP